MSMQKYEAFVRTVELGSLSLAAEELGYTQSGVSHMLSSLEDELGIRLVTRSRAGVRLTDAGERVLPVMRGILGGEEQLRQIIADVRGLDAGTVRVGAFTSVAVHWLPEILKEFQDVYPGIRFQLKNGDYYDVENWLHSREIDVGFVRMPFEGGFFCTPLVEDRLLAILPKGHPLARRKRFPIKQAAREPFISLPESSAQDTRTPLDAAGVKPDIRFTTKDDYALIAMVASGLGMSIVPELLLSGRENEVAALELDTPSSRTIGLAMQPEETVGPATVRFVSHVMRWVRENCPSAVP